MYLTRKTEGFSLGAGVCASKSDEKVLSRRPAKETHARSNTKIGRILAPAAILVAGVAGGGAVTITANSLMDTVRLSLLVRRRCVAVDAGEAGVVRGNLVAVVAHRAVVRNREIGVVECGAEPTGGRVASVTGL